MQISTNAAERHEVRYIVIGGAATEARGWRAESPAPVAPSSQARMLAAARSRAADTMQTSPPT
jgi:hypothetical protein